jgi:hypothetical protein
LRAILTIDGTVKDILYSNSSNSLIVLPKSLAYGIEIENEKNVTGSFEIQIGMTVKHALLSIVA